MRRKSLVPAAALAGVAITFAFAAQDRPTEKPRYLWLADDKPRETAAQRFTPPAGFERVAAAPGSFADWLRGLPLKPAETHVRLFDGQLKPRQDLHAAVIDIDAGEKDLQQCADAIIRLRAEHLYAAGKLDQIAFHFTNGTPSSYRDWSRGMRPKIAGRRVTWVKSAAPEESYAALKAYLQTVFIYAGTISLKDELQPVPPGETPRPGDVYIQGGSPGHAVLVLDVATHPQTKKSVMLLAQSFMPAQDVHVLKNLKDAALNPWVAVDFGDRLETPEWTFERGDLGRFGD